MKSLLPALVFGAVLLALVFGARCAQDKMHEYETRVSTDNPNSSPNELAENERIAEKFPDTLQTTAGLRFKILREGTGEKPIAGSRVKVNYVGRLIDGTVFDSTSDRGEPYEFTLMKGEVIRGWDLALMDMRKGEKRLVVIPSKLAYGTNGKPPTIPPRASLVFEIELVDFSR